MKTKLLLILFIIGLQLNLNAQVAHDYKQGCCKLVGAINNIESCYCAGCADTAKKNKEAKAAEDKRVKDLSIKKAEEQRQAAIEKQKKENEAIAQKNKDAKANTLHYGMVSSEKIETKKPKRDGNQYKVEVLGDRMECQNPKPVLHKIYKNGKFIFEKDNYYWIEPFLNNETGVFWASTSRNCKCDYGINREVFLNNKGEEISIAGISKFYVAYKVGNEALVAIYDGSCEPDYEGESYVESRWGTTDYYLSLDDFSLLRTEKSKAKSPCDCDNIIKN